jgi:hypothetical protein
VALQPKPIPAFLPRLTYPLSQFCSIHVPLLLFALLPRQ